MARTKHTVRLPNGQRSERRHFPSFPEVTQEMSSGRTSTSLPSEDEKEGDLATPSVETRWTTALTLGREGKVQRVVQQGDVKGMWARRSKPIVLSDDNEERMTPRKTKDEAKATSESPQPVLVIDLSDNDQKAKAASPRTAEVKDKSLNKLRKDSLDFKEDRMRELKAEINALNKEVAKLEKQQRETAEEAEKRTNTVKSLSMERDTLAKQVKEKDCTIHQLESRVASMERTLTELSRGRQPPPQPQPQLAPFELDVTSLPRVTRAMVTTELKQECKHRGLKTSGKKDDLIQRLGLNSICVTATVEYKQKQRIDRNVEEIDILQRREKADQEERQRKERERLLHRFNSTVHPCPLAKTEDLPHPNVEHWKRANSASCNYCHKINCIWTCTKCDFDICRTCYFQKTTDPKELQEEKERKQRIEKERIAEQKRREKERIAEQKRREKERIAEQKREEIRQREIEREIKEKFRYLPAKVKVVAPARRKHKNTGFCVWQSMGYPNDGWHSYHGPPDKVFDSCWPTLKDANARATFLFYFRNTWGLRCSELMDPRSRSIEDIEESFTGEDGDHLCLKLSAADSQVITVAVTPSIAFLHLEHSAMPTKWDIERQERDEQNEPNGQN